jgi:hypothetical protein
MVFVGSIPSIEVGFARVKGSLIQSLLGRWGSPTTGGFRLWFARILRLTGLAVFSAIVAQWTLLTLGLGFAWASQPPPPIISNISLTIPLVGLSIALLVIGDKISPPDSWLDPWLSPFRGHKPSWRQKGPEPQEEGEFWATVTFDPLVRPGSATWKLTQGQRCYVEFDDGFMFLGQQGKELDLIEPKKILRASDKTLSIDTGQYSYGEITLTFDSASDADKVKREIAKLTVHIHFRHGQIPPTFPE